MSEKVRDFTKLGGDIVNIVGGPDNIISATHCATRLRFVLKELPAGAKEKISSLPGVVSSRESGGQFQVVIGTHVKQVYDAIVDKYGFTDEADGDNAPKESLVNKLIKTMSGVFAPFIYVLAAAGILQGALILINIFWPAFEETGTYELLALMSWTPFTFLPVFIGLTAAHHFKVNIYTAVLCTAALVNPSLTEMAGRVADGENVNIFGLAMSPTVYTSTVLPPLILVWLLSHLERWLNKVLPDVVRPLFSPLICLLIMVPLTVLALGPISNGGAIAVAEGYNWLVEIAPPVAAAVVGGLWQVLVIFGFHWGITPVIMANFAEYGSDSFQAFQTAAVIGQVGAAAGVFLKAKSRKLKSVAGAAVVPGIFGITEPAIFGVNLRLKKPFIVGLVFGGIGAVVMSFFGSRYYVYAGLPGPFTMVNGHEPGTASITGILIGSAIAFLGPICALWFIKIQDVLDEDSTTPLEKASPEELADFQRKIDQGTVKERILSPLDGKIIPLVKVDDPVFSTGAMGDGIAINPLGDQVRAPFAGTIVALLPSKHAIGIRSESGIEILIHVGLDTVTLKGSPFTTHVAQGDHVQSGDLLLEFDRESIQHASLSLITPVIVTNSKKLGSIVATPQRAAVTGDELLVVMEPEPTNQTSTI